MNRLSQVIEKGDESEDSDDIASMKNTKDSLLENN